MKITIKEITDPTIWENFLLEQKNTPFFQSWDWGEVQKSIGFSIFRLGIYESGRLRGIVLYVHVKSRRGSFYHLRHGPVIFPWDWKYVQVLLDYLKVKAKKESVSFIRMAPLVPATDEIINQFESHGFINAPIHNMDAENAWIVDLDKSEDELLREMRKTTRYLIRKAEKMGVRVVQSKNSKDMQAFMELYKDTAKRQGFIAHKGIEEEFKLFSKDDCVLMFEAFYQNKLIAAAIIMFYGNEAVYHHSGMRSDSGDIPASYLLQWEAIKEAKKRGMKRYNLWGVAPEDKPNHPWKGLSLFKKGFGGHAQTSIHAQDLPLSNRYWITWLIETSRRIKRGY